MKSYLDLIPISAKIHKKQTRMTRLCILFSAFLIAAIFGMADMYIQCMTLQTIQEEGSWHAGFRNVDDPTCAMIAARPEVKTASQYAAFNYRLDKDVSVQGVKTAVVGAEESLLQLYPALALTEGSFPKDSGEIACVDSVRKQLGLGVGDSLTLHIPQGDRTFRISGIMADASMILKAGAYGVVVDMDTFYQLFPEVDPVEERMLYVEFKPQVRIQAAISDTCAQMGLSTEQVGQNARLLGLMLQSNDGFITSLYGVAAILAVLVALSGMFMVLGSLNSNVAQRTAFFGMLRCLGAEKKQVRRYVHLEALSWCGSAIPEGLGLSVVIVWILCAMLRKISPEYFGEMPVLAVSWISLLAGSVLGILTVLAAARAPARRAAAVSPLTAVSGNASTAAMTGRAWSADVLQVEPALGIHHAMGSRKNLLLVSGSFAFSILLFLSFSTGVDFMGHALVPVQPYTPDVSIVSPDNSCSIPDSLLQEIEQEPSVKRAFGRSFAYDLPGRIGGQETVVTLISYEEHQFGWSKRSLIAGKMDPVQEGKGVLIVADETLTGSVGDSLSISTALGEQTVTVEGILEYAPFNTSGIVICSENLFRQLTGEQGYTILDIQMRDLSDPAAERIRQMAGPDFDFSDRRLGNREVRGVYFAAALFVYGFLAIIAMIAAFNIINTMALSVSARMRQYGAMRAIGATVSQLRKMVAWETGTYMIFGCLAGLLVGLPLHRFLFTTMITNRWGDPWTFPTVEVCLILGVMLASSIAAAIGPIRRLKALAVVQTIAAQ